MVKTIDEGLKATKEGKQILKDFAIAREEWLKAQEIAKEKWNKLQEIANKKHYFMRL